MRKQAKFLKLVRQGFTDAGMTEITEGQSTFVMDTYFQYRAETVVGGITILLPKDPENKCFTCFAKFDEPQRAYEKYPAVNRFSGKYNLHLGWKISAETGATSIVNYYSRTLLKKLQS